MTTTEDRKYAGWKMSVGFLLVSGESIVPLRLVAFDRPDPDDEILKSHTCFSDDNDHIPIAWRTLSRSMLHRARSAFILGIAAALILTPYAGSQLAYLQVILRNIPSVQLVRTERTTPVEDSERCVSASTLIGRSHGSLHNKAIALIAIDCSKRFCISVKCESVRQYARVLHDRIQYLLYQGHKP